jgi:hypothetical protein
LEEVAVFLGVWVEVCEEDLDDWGWVDGAAISITCAAGSCGDGLLADVEVVSGLGRWASRRGVWFWGVVEELVEAVGHSVGVSRLGFRFLFDGRWCRVESL